MRNLLRKLLVLFVITIIMGGFLGMAVKSFAVDIPPIEPPGTGTTQKLPPTPEIVTVKTIGVSGGKGIFVKWKVSSILYTVVSSDQMNTETVYPFYFKVAMGSLSGTQICNGKAVPPSVTESDVKYSGGYVQCTYNSPINTSQDTDIFVQTYIPNGQPLGEYENRSSIIASKRLSAETGTAIGTANHLISDYQDVCGSMDKLFSSDPADRKLYWNDTSRAEALIKGFFTNSVIHSTELTDTGRELYDPMVTNLQNAKSEVDALYNTYGWKDDNAMPQIITACGQSSKKIENLGQMKESVTFLINGFNASGGESGGDVPPQGGIGTAMEAVFKWIDGEVGAAFGWVMNSLFMPAMGVQTLHDDLKNPDKQPWIFSIWKFSISVVDIVIIIILIAISFVNILNINIDTYAIKKTLPTLILGVILANFSLLICRMIVDSSSILISTFAGNPETLGTQLTSALRVSQIGSGVLVAGIGVGIFGGLAPGGIMILIGILIMFIPVLAIAFLAILLYIRIGVVYLFAAISPLAFMAMSFPPTQNLFRRWWSMFTTWVFMAPIVLFLMRVAALISRDQAGLVGWMAACAILYTAIMVPFKMGGVIMSAWGGAIKLATGTNKGGFLRSAAEREFAGAKADVGLAARRLPGLGGLITKAQTRKGKVLSKPKMLELMEEEEIKTGYRSEMFSTKYDSDDAIEKARQTDVSSKGNALAQSAGMENIKDLLLTQDELMNPATNGIDRENHFAAVQALEMMARHQTLRTKQDWDEAERVVKGGAFDNKNNKGMNMPIDAAGKPINIWNLKGNVKNKNISEPTAVADTTTNQRAAQTIISNPKASPLFADDQEFNVDTINARLVNAQKSTGNANTHARAQLTALGLAGSAMEDAMGKISEERYEKDLTLDIGGAKVDADSDAGRTIREYKEALNTEETLAYTALQGEFNPVTPTVEAMTSAISGKIRAGTLDDATLTQNLRVIQSVKDKQIDVGNPTAVKAFQDLGVEITPEMRIVDNPAGQTKIKQAVRGAELMSRRSVLDAVRQGKSIEDIRVLRNYEAMVDSQRAGRLESFGGRLDDLARAHPGSDPTAIVNGAQGSLVGAVRNNLNVRLSQQQLQAISDQIGQIMRIKRQNDPAADYKKLVGESRSEILEIINRTVPTPPPKMPPPPPGQNPTPTPPRPQQPPTGRPQTPPPGNQPPPGGQAGPTGPRYPNP